MVRRLLWFAFGAGIAIFVYTKIRQSMRKASPEALGQRVGDTANGISEFIDRFRTGMAERETELRETLGMPENQPPR